jgi:hypothetical protein
MHEKKQGTKKQTISVDIAKKVLVFLTEQYLKEKDGVQHVAILIQCEIETT